MPTVVCLYCGKSFLARQQRKYCNQTCSAKSTVHLWQKPKQIRVICTECGAECFKPPSQIAANKTGQFFCTMRCLRQQQQRNRPVLTCAQCGVTFQRSPANVRKKNIKHFCSEKCDYDYHAGPRHSRWLGGRSRWYGRGWKAARRDTLQRYGSTCQRCGRTNRLVVHHIIPWRVSRSHAPENLTILCDFCHQTVEAEYWRSHPAVQLRLDLT